MLYRYAGLLALLRYPPLNEITATMSDDYLFDYLIISRGEHAASNNLALLVRVSNLPNDASIRVYSAIQHHPAQRSSDNMNC